MRKQDCGSVSRHRRARRPLGFFGANRIFILPTHHLHPARRSEARLPGQTANLSLCGPGISAQHVGPKGGQRVRGHEAPTNHESMGASTRRAGRRLRWLLCRVIEQWEKMSNSLIPMNTVSASPMDQPTAAAMPAHWNYHQCPARDGRACSILSRRAFLGASGCDRAGMVRMPERRRARDGGLRKVGSWVF